MLWKSASDDDDSSVSLPADTRGPFAVPHIYTDEGLSALKDVFGPFWDRTGTAGQATPPKTPKSFAQFEKEQMERRIEMQRRLEEDLKERLDSQQAKGDEPESVPSVDGRLVVRSPVKQDNPFATLSRTK